MASFIDYDQIIQKSLLRAVRQILSDVEKEGLKGTHHFYISFRTDRPDVVLPNFLRERHPHEITIVLQYQFWDLKVLDNEFSVTLSFNNDYETVRVPFSAIISFVDPSVKFGLQFNPSGEPELLDDGHKNKSFHAKAKSSKSDISSHKGDSLKERLSPPEMKDNVVALDKFRKNNP